MDPETEKKDFSGKYVNKVCSLVLKTKQFLDSTTPFSSDSVCLGNLYLHLKLSRGSSDQSWESMSLRIIILGCHQDH